MGGRGWRMTPLLPLDRECCPAERWSSRCKQDLGRCGESAHRSIVVCERRFKGEFFSLRYRRGSNIHVLTHARRNLTSPISISHSHSISSTNRRESKKLKSSSCSPCPTNRVGTVSSSCIAITHPPFPEPSSFVTMIPVRPVISLNSRA